MKQIIVYLFCVSITIQSIVGQFMFYNDSTDTFYTPTPSFSHFSQGTDATKQEYNSTNNTYTDKTETNAELPKVVCDSVMEHLFSPSSCPEAGPAFICFPYLFLGHCFDLFVIEERINNFIHFYASFFRNIQIGLPITKLIYPYHNFY